MFAVFGVNYSAIQLKESKKGGSEAEIEERIQKSFQKKTKLRVSPVYSDPDTCKTAMNMIRGDKNFSNLEIRHHLHRIVPGKNGGERIKKSWVRYQGEKDLQSLLININSKKK